MAPRSHSGLEYLDSKTIKFRSKKYLFISILKTASVNICQKMRQYLKLVLICGNNVGDHDLWVFSASSINVNEEICSTNFFLLFFHSFEEWREKDY